MRFITKLATREQLPAFLDEVLQPGSGFRLAAITFSGVISYPGNKPGGEPVYLIVFERVE